ncbi:ABC transporter substrate-binding protein [Domibacillus sp. PGB-M46]|uniref:ABC transporter substrate-binding protein n=1 Tax=Domibacillus sp. PGB-M46 TaxID=2910255 RepID=UPI001F57813D|nr:ABC transporter substrate-binding protein [Domibacillus sp. PGB-M46]MCI2254935.1 ABC transporter substrate-binding protein [Domibacillus sp. PGB-M46]
MKKTWITLGLSAALLAGCGGGEEKKTDTAKENEPAKETAAFPVTVTDAEGTKVEIEEAPDKIVSLIPSNTEIAFELGLGDEIAGVSDFDNYPEEVAQKEKIGGSEFNVEKIIGLDTDLVLAHASSAHNSKEGLQQLRDAGIDVLVVNDAQNFEQVYDSIEMIGEATGKKKEADAEVKEMKEGLAEIEEKASGIKGEDEKSVYIEVSPAPNLFTPGKNTFMNEMLELIHANNAMSSQAGWAQVSEEAVIKANPDVIVTTYGYYTENAVEQLMARQGWSTIPAVENKSVVDVNSDLVSRPGPRLVEGVEALAEAVYPDVFTQ